MALKFNARHGLSVGSTPTDILDTSGNISINDATFTGQIKAPATFIIDPAAIGDNTGLVVIKGDLQVDGLTTTVNSTTVTVNDKNVVLGNVTTPTNLLADGGGITLKGGTDKTLNWINATTSWTSSENFDLASGKAYYIAGTSVLNATTLGSNVVNSSLTGTGIVTSGTWKSTIILPGSSTGTTTFASGNTSATSYAITVPAATDTLVGKATTDIFTNKTYDTAGTGNVFKINGTAISTVTGSGKVVLDTSPTLVTPVLGDATATTINKVTITAPTTSAVLTIANGKTLTANASITLAGTDSSTITVGGNVTVTGAFATTVAVTAVTSVTLPTSGTLVGSNDTGTVTNTMLAGSITNAKLVNSSITINSTAVSLGGTITGLATTAGTLAQFAATTSAQLAGVISDETGTGVLVFSNTPTLVTPVLGDATATTINKVTITAPTTSAALTIANGKTLTANASIILAGTDNKTLTLNNSLTFGGTDASSVAFGGGGTVTYTSNNLSVFAATTSSQLAGVISDETGTGALVFANTPTLVTPVLGVATATSINKVTITAPTSSAALTIADGKTLSANASITLAGTDNSTISVGGNVTFSGAFATTVTVTALTSVTLPTSGTLVGSNDTGTVTNTMLAGSITNAKLVNSSISINGSAISLGGSVTGLATTAGTLAQFASTTSAQLAGVISDETGTGVLVFSNTPTLVTPVLGVATATSINKVTITAPTTSAALTIADSKTLTANASITLAGTDNKTLTLNNSLTFSGTDASSIAFGGGGTVTYTSNNLSVFAATTSAQLAGVISDETGTGVLVFSNTPTLVTPVLGVATATSINKVTITAPTTSAGLTIADGKTLSANASITLAGTDSSIISVGGNVTVSGAFATTIAVTAATSVTLPTTGTLISNTGVGVVSNGMLANSSISINGSAVSLGGSITGLAVTSGTLAQFAATTSAQLAGVISDETGTGVLVFSNTPTLVTPVLGVATATSINKVTITAPTTSAALTIADSKTLTANASITLAGTDSSTISVGGNVTFSGAFATTVAVTAATSVTLPTSGTLVGSNDTGTVTNTMLAGSITNAKLVNSSISINGSAISLGGSVTGLATTAGTLAQFAATTSSQLAGVISDETGSGALVFANTPTLVTPVLGVATATSINKVTITAPTTSAGLTIADGKTLTSNASITLAGTDGKILTTNASITLAGTDSSVISVGGNVTFSGAFATTVAVTAATSVTMPTSGTLISSAGTGVVTNTMLANNSITINGTVVALGGSISTGGNTVTAIKTAAYTAAANDFVRANTSGGSFAITMPLNPADGTIVSILDTNGTFGTNSLSVLPNTGKTIEGDSTSLILDINGSYASFTYINATNNWKLLQTSLSGGSTNSAMTVIANTTTATPTIMTTDGLTAGAANQLILTNDSTYTFSIMIVARRTDVDNESAGFKIEGVVDRNTNAASTALVGSVVKTIFARDDLAWDCSVTADTTNGGINVTVTGEASKSISWVATINTIKITG